MDVRTLRIREGGLFADQGGRNDEFSCALAEDVCEEVGGTVEDFDTVSADGLGISRAESVDVDDVAGDADGCAGTGTDTVGTDGAGSGRADAGVGADGGAAAGAHVWQVVGGRAGLLAET